MSVAFGGGVGRVGGGGGCRGGGGGGRQNRRRPRRRPNPGLSLTVFVALSPEHRGAAIGRGGANIRELQEVSGATVKVPPVGRGGRVKVQGAEVALLAACRRIATSVATVLDHGYDNSNLECTVDAGPAGRMVGTMYLPKDGETLLFRAENTNAGGCAGSSSSMGDNAVTQQSIAYTAHAVRADPTVAVTQDDVDVTLDNLTFARGGDVQPVYACVRDGHIFISGLVVESVDLAVREMMRLARSGEVGGGGLKQAD